MSTRAAFQAHVDSLQAESLPFVWQWSLPATVLKRETLAWGPGTQTLTLPTGTTLVVINPPTTTTASMRVGSNAGTIATDGWEIAHNVPTVLTVSGVTSKILYASLAVTNIEVTYF